MGGAATQSGRDRRDERDVSRSDPDGNMAAIKPAVNTPQRSLPTADLPLKGAEQVQAPKHNLDVD